MVTDKPGNHDIVFLRKRKPVVQRRSDQFAVFRHRRLENIPGHVRKHDGGILLLST